jgi:electron-transferring-flavoprotein dehydrogenase
MNSPELLERFGPREAMDYDMVVVGGGPAGLATAIRVKQLKPDASVVVLEKGAEPGAHTLSGAVNGPACADRTAAGLEGARRAAAAAGDG